MRKHQIGKNGPVETDGAALNIAAQIFLKSSVGETRAKEFVLAEEDEKHGGCHAYHGNGLKRVCEKRRHASKSIFSQAIFCHARPVFPARTRTLAPTSISARRVVANVLFERTHFAVQILDPPLQYIANREHPEQLAIVIHYRKVPEVALDHRDQSFTWPGL